MLYQPGPKARDEFRAFTKRGGPTLLEIEPLEPPRRRRPIRELEHELIRRGVTADRRRASWPAEHAEEKIRAQIERLDWLSEKKPEKIDDPPPTWSGHQERLCRPEGFRLESRSGSGGKRPQAKERQAAEERRRKQHEEATLRAEGDAVDSYIKRLSPAERAEHEAAALAYSEKEYRDNYSNPAMARLRDPLLLGMLRNYVGDMLKQGRATVDA